MTKLKQIAKNVAGKTLIRTGLWRRHLEKMAKRGEGIVLTYHRLIEKWDRTLDYSQPGLVVTTDTFDRQLRFLKQYFNIVPLSFLINAKSEMQNPKCSDRPFCSITFDDGWRDNYELAFPILQKEEVPATIFLTTDFGGTDRVFWHTELMYLLMRRELRRIDPDEPAFQVYPAPVRHRLRQLARSAETPSATDLDSLIEVVKAKCNDDAIDDLIRDLRRTLGIRGSLFPERRFFLDWDQVREMASAGVEIGSHGCSHRILTRLNPQEAEEELLRSKAEIERHIGQRVQHFAFPDGAANRELISKAGKAGYRSACLCASGPDEGPVGSLALRRKGMHEGVSTRGGGSFSEELLALWLSRGPRIRM